MPIVSRSGSSAFSRPVVGAVALATLIGLTSAPALAQDSLNWSLSNGQLGPGLEYGAVVSGATWKPSGMTIPKNETVAFTAEGVKVSSTGQNDYGFGTYFPLSGAYIVTVDIQLSTLKGLAGLIFDDYPDVFVYPNGTVISADSGVTLGIATADPNGWITLGFQSDGVNPFQAGFGVPGGPLTWTTLSDVYRPVNSVNAFVSGQHFAPAKASALMRNLTITTP